MHSHTLTFHLIADIKNITHSKMAQKKQRSTQYYYRRLVLYTGMFPLMSEMHVTKVKIFCLSRVRGGVTSHMLEKYIT